MDFENKTLIVPGLSQQNPFLETKNAMKINNTMLNSRMGSTRKMTEEDLSEPNSPRLRAI